METNSTLTNKSWLLILAGGLLFSIFGLWVLFTPIETLKTIIIILGVLTMASGITEAVLALHQKSAFKGNVMLLAEGAFDLVIGFLLIAYPEILLKIFSLMVGAFLVYKGLLNLYNAFNYHKTDKEKFRLKIGLGLLLIGLAVVLMWHPAILGLTLAIWLGFTLLAYGIFRIGLARKIKNGTLTL